jgi:hypothetical protein
MGKKWKSNAVFHTYYLQLKRAIDVFPCITPNTLHRFKPFVKFHVDKHFIYIITHEDEHKEVLQSYYKLTEEDLEEITKWHVYLLIPIHHIELSDPKLIGSSMVSREGYDTPRTGRRKKT